MSWRGPDDPVRWNKLAADLSRRWALFCYHVGTWFTDRERAERYARGQLMLVFNEAVGWPYTHWAPPKPWEWMKYPWIPGT